MASSFFFALLQKLPDTEWYQTGHVSILLTWTSNGRSEQNQSGWNLHKYSPSLPRSLRTVSFEGSVCMLFTSSLSAANGHKIFKLQICQVIRSS